MTTAHINFDSTKPSGSSSPTTFANDLLNNLIALRDLIIAGVVPGFVQSRTNGTGTANQPQYVTWYNSALGVGFRWNITWTGFQPTTVAEEWTNDSAVSWLAVVTQVNTFDASSNITASTVSGGFAVLVMEVWAKCLKVVSDLAAHAALAVASAPHGVGTIASQSAAAVALTGGTADGVAIGNTTRAAGSFTRVVEDRTLYTPTLNAGVVVDWSKGGSNITTNGVNAITFSSIPAGMAGHRIYIDNLNNVTWPTTVSFGVGYAAGVAPSIAGTVGITLDTINSGTNIQASVGWRAV